jgi:hypothetical protein
MEVVAGEDEGEEIDSETLGGAGEDAADDAVDLRRWAHEETALEAAASDEVEALRLEEAKRSTHGRQW